MGWFSSVKKAVNKVGSSVKSAVSTVGSKVTSTVSTVGSKVQSGAKIVGTNIKNSVSKESLTSFVQGVAQGGLVNGIIQAGATTAAKSMEDLDKSGKFNSDYAYKQYGFPSKSEFELAQSYGYDDYSAWLAVKDMLGSDITITEVAPTENVSSSYVDAVGNIQVTNDGSSDSVVISDKSNMLKTAVIGVMLAKMLGVF